MPYGAVRFFVRVYRLSIAKSGDWQMKTAGYKGKYASKTALKALAVNDAVLP